MCNNGTKALPLFHPHLFFLEVTSTTFTATHLHLHFFFLINQYLLKMSHFSFIFSFLDHPRFTKSILILIFRLFLLGQTTFTKSFNLHLLFCTQSLHTGMVTTIIIIFLILCWNAYLSSSSSFLLPLSLSLSGHHYTLQQPLHPLPELLIHRPHPISVKKRKKTIKRKKEEEASHLLEHVIWSGCLFYILL